MALNKLIGPTKNTAEEVRLILFRFTAILRSVTTEREATRMWANAQPDGRPAEHRWRPLFNAAKFR